MNADLIHYLECFRGKEVIVWGDLILDEYILTSTGRISREAPVLVTEFESNEYKLGGAGNVIMNIKALGAQPLPVGLIGSDKDGDSIIRLLERQNITTEYISRLKDYRTPKKSRILSGGDNTKKQQVLRIDTLNRGPVSSDYFRQMKKVLDNLMERARLMILSDYLHESVQPELFQQLRKQNDRHIYIIDSRKHFLNFRNVTFATPNEPEIRKIFPGHNFYSDDDFLSAGEEFLRLIEAKGIVLKRGHKGMIVLETDHPPRTIDIYGSSNIVDVTGAGDTVISVVGLSALCGAGLYDGARLANIAAGLVVMKEGCYPIPHQELRNALQ